MHKFSNVLLGAALSALVLGTANANSLSMSTGSDGGGYDKTICEEAVKSPAQEQGISVTCTPSDGSIMNMKLVNSGDLDSGITQTDLLYKAWEEGSEWADNLNPGGRSFTLESLLCITSGGKVGGMKQLTELTLKGKKWKVLTPKVGSGSHGTVEYLFNSLPGYSEAAEIVPVEKWDINKVISRLSSGNPKQRADVACTVGLPDPKGNNNVKKASANESISFVPMDDNRALQLEFGDQQVYPAIAAVPVTGGVLAWVSGNVKTVDALQVPVTYVYNENINGEALEMLTSTIDDNQNFLLDSGMMGKIMSKLNEGKDLAMGVAKRVSN